MIQPISNSNALRIAQQAMKNAMKEVDAAAQKVASEKISAENMIELELAKKNMQAQQVSMEAAIQASQQVLDIIVK